ncbi:MAG: YjbE family putative metal transport protein [Alphaproteobacteria bacterium]|nr:YjbE family putative metal transport protein [Alphaproteobacteria bacterium]
MDIISDFQFDLTTFMQVVFIDLVLSGDNAIIIGMAAAALPPALRQKAIVWGIALAVILRIVLAALTVYLLTITGLKLVGGLLLFVVCYQLWKDLASDGHEDSSEEAGSQDDDAAGTRDSGVLSPMFLRAMATIIVADVSMSLDNVLGVAGAAKDNVPMLVFGLVLSIVLMAAGANIVARMLNRYQWIGYIGLAVIVWVAGEMTYHGFVEVHEYLSV